MYIGTHNAATNLAHEFQLMNFGLTHHKWCVLQQLSENATHTPVTKGIESPRDINDAKSSPHVHCSPILLRPNEQFWRAVPD